MTLMLKFLAVRIAHAQPELHNPLGGQTFESILTRLVSYLTTIGSIVVTIMIIIGAFQMIFAAGKPDDFKKGQKTIVYAVVGLVIILIANGISAVVHSILVTS